MREHSPRAKYVDLKDKSQSTGMNRLPFKVAGVILWVLSPIIASVLIFGMPGLRAVPLVGILVFALGTWTFFSARDRWESQLGKASANRPGIADRDQYGSRQRNSGFDHGCVQAADVSDAHNGVISAGPTQDPWELYTRELGLSLQKARAKRGLMQEDLAHTAGITTFTYRKLEKGESNPGTPANPRLKTLISLADALDISLPVLLPAWSGNGLRGCAYFYSIGDGLESDS